MKPCSVFNPPIPAKAGQHDAWGQLHGNSLSLAILHAAKQMTAPLLVICDNNLRATELEDNLHFFNQGHTELPIALFPDWETLPYDQFSPHQDIISQRLHLLSSLPHQQKGIVLTSISNLMPRIAPPNYFTAQHFHFLCGQKLNINTFRQGLEANAYYCVPQVMIHGEFAIRGSIIDIYPMGYKLPLRIELFDNDIESIRTFDPETQCSIDKIDHINLLPAKEFPLTQDAITHFRGQWRELFPGNPAQCSIYNDISEGIAPAGIEYYLPLFFQHTASLLDYLPENTVIIRTQELSQAADLFWQEINERYEQRCGDITRPLLPPTKVFIPSADLFAQLKAFRQISIKDDAKLLFETQTPPKVPVDHKATEPLSALQTLLQDDTRRYLFCAETAGRREALRDLFSRIQVHPKSVDTWDAFLQDDAPYSIIIAPLQRGLLLNNPPITLITESQLFGQQVLQRRRRKQRTFDAGVIFKDLAELQLGQAVVHTDYGVGRYLGLQMIKTEQTEGEYLTLEYADNDKIYVPVTSLYLISRYSGTDVEHAPLHKLGTDRWNRQKRLATEKIHDTAAELLAIYAQREAAKGFQFEKPDQQYDAFVAKFPFEETPDQQQCIEHIIADMNSDKRLDRLVCGDVGFGKTEVAMRAAFIATQSHKQVAILVPTTLLAAQHFTTFSDRFADFPVNIELLSRFRTAKEQDAVLEGLVKGTVDIVIGTHKLLQKDITFHDLGLLIIDEEHRFGVKQKERLKQLRAEVDLLTLTATPIPRTLNMSLAGMRDISLITTPPEKRLSIKTFVQERNNPTIREAVLREIMRGGQVFFLHNNVDTLPRIVQELAALIPEANIHMAHGQMRERALENIMRDFYHHRFNVLVCTTIIENGIDIPTANTIIIDRADRFGLAQLHQLRGRVGRSHHQAYAYLMTPHPKAMSKDAHKRLEALTSLEDLGAGFTLASHDLEIRGAGELLGDEQSGHMQTIGFELYMELLDRTVKALKEGQSLDDMKKVRDCDINLQIPALIPENYMPDVHQRLTLYKRIANTPDLHSLKELKIEMIDRFGLLPDQVNYLFHVTQLKLQGLTLGISKINANAKGGRFEFIEKPDINPETIIKLIQQTDCYQLAGPQQLRFTIPSTTPKERLDVIEKTLSCLST